MSLPDDFVLRVDKPEGPTSHDIVSAVRRALHRRRVGHTGTLDPFASGLLLVCVGRATRLAEYLSGLDKTYDAVAKLGETTDTLDREGQVVETRGGWEKLDRSSVEEVLDRFRGRLEQIPPAFSAKKVRGESAHRRVRRGELVELPPSDVIIRALELTSLEPPLLGLRIRCSSGTYVRALARDLGEALGPGAHLVGLRRTAIGGFMIEGSLRPDGLEDEEAVKRALIEPLQALAHLPTVVADEEDADRLRHGRPVEARGSPGRGTVAISHAGALLAVGESEDGVLRPRKVFAP